MLSEEIDGILLSPRQLEVWQDTLDAIGATPKELLEKSGIPGRTINQMPSKLLDLKKIERLGIGRARRYKLSQK